MYQPLADQLRPKSLDEVAGQRHILGEQGVLRRIIQGGTIPNDPEKPFVTSGIRVGVPAATSRGLREEDMKVIGQLIWKTATEFDTKQDEIRAAVAEITAKYPLYE